MLWYERMEVSHSGLWAAEWYSSAFFFNRVSKFPLTFRKPVMQDDV